MIYHHAITAAAAKHRTQDFIAQAEADARAARPTKARRWTPTIRSRLLSGRTLRGLARTNRQATTY